MTYAALLAELASVRVHPLTETSVRALIVTPHGIDCDVDDSSLRDELDDTRKDRDTLDAELKQSEAEAEALRAELERVGDKQLSAADLAAECARFRDACSEWATHCQTLRAELAALRKRKGVEPGVAAHSREIWALLWAIAQTEGHYQAQAADLARKISRGA